MASYYRWTTRAIVVVALILSLPVILRAQTTEPCLEEKAKRHLTEYHEQNYQACLRMYRMQKIFESPYVMAVHAFKDGHERLGTGVVRKIDERWYIITNNHVIEGANEIFVRFSHGHEKIYSVSLAGRDPAADIALLEAPILPRGVGSVAFGNKPRIGEEIYALGYPYGMRSVTLGFVNALSTWALFYFLTQTPVNPGNSGGPLFNAQHEMIGLNTAIISGAMMSLTLSMEYAEMILPRLTREKLVEHGAAGFSFADSAQILPVFFTKHSLIYPPTEQGIMVMDLDIASDAAKSHIRVGDIVTHLNNVPIRNAQDFEKRLFLGFHPGEEVMFTTKRGAQMFERKIKLMAYVSAFAKKEKKDE